MKIRILSGMGLDRAIVVSMATSLSSVVTGPITALLVATELSQMMQGYYYTFGSLTTIRFVAELGMGHAILQFVSHEWSVFSAGGVGSRIAEAELRLSSIARLALRWYGFAILCLVPLLILGGSALFASGELPDLEWKPQWITLSIGVGINLLFVPALYVVQGLDRMADFWMYRFVQQWVVAITLWLSIASGLGLWALSLSALVSLLWSVVFLLVWQRDVVKLFRRRGPIVLSWRRDLWPLQWRVGLSSLSSVYTQQVFAPFAFRFFGSIAAGQVGLTVTIANLIVTISQSWMQTAAAKFGRLVALGKPRDEKRLFSRLYSRSLATVFLSVLATIVMMSLLDLYYQELSTRLLPLSTSLWLFFAAIGATAVGGVSILARAHKKEPLVASYAIVSALSIVGGGAFAVAGSISGMLATYGLAIAIIQLPWAWKVRRSLN